jgi:hypothetical protein
MRFLSSVLFLAVLTAPAMAQPWYARGEFNAWGIGNGSSINPVDPYPMVDEGGGHYTSLIGQHGDFFDNQPYNYKIATSDWSIEMPGLGGGNDGRVYTDVNGQIKFHMYDQTTWNDGWSPTNVRRVGYDDHQQFDWEVVGSFNSWPGAADPAFKLTDMGNGLHVGTFAMPANGVQEFKFRGLTTTEWDTTIGQFFRNSANNNTFVVGTAGDPWTFELDLPNGRFRYFTTAEPAGQDGDFNQNGLVDAADYTKWRDNLGSTTALPNDPNGTPVGAAAYDTWKAHFGQGTLLTWMSRHTIIGAQPQIPDTNLTNLGGGNYEANYTGLTAGENYDFRILKTDLSTGEPDQNMRVRANAAGEINLNFYELQSASWNDGWSPSTSHRVGYEDPEQFGWEIVGSINGWPGANDPAFALTAQGNGLYTGAFTFNTPGNFAFKFRHLDPTNAWNISTGDKFGNNAANIPLTITNPGELWHFELDLPNGRWRAYLDGTGAGSLSAVPEPASLAIVMLGLICGAAAAGRHR